MADFDPVSYMMGQKASGGGGGSSSGGVLIVTYTLTGKSSEDGGTATCDHTLAQILSAISAGKIVFAKVIPDRSAGDANTYLLPLAEFVIEDYPDAYFDLTWGSIIPGSPPDVNIYNTWVDHFTDDDEEMIDFEYNAYISITGHS